MIKAYSTSVATYPQIRTFYRAHPQGDKLPDKPKPLPLLVFIHGLGGSLAQFNPLLATLSNLAPCFGIDLPGCGLSGFSPRQWNAYSHEALVELWMVAIQQACNLSSTREVVLIGHSMGCSLSASLAAPASKHSQKVGFDALGLIGICPRASTPSESELKAFRRLLNVPGPIFDLWRRWDRRGGMKSPSVTRFVGPNAHQETKRLQLQFNEASQTDVWRRMAWGMLPRPEDGVLGEGLPGPAIWGSMTIPMLLVAGEADTITKPQEISVIRKALDETVRANSRTSVLSSPASHALLYDYKTYRTLSGLIQSFLSDQIDHRLSLGWQLQHLKEANKWDVKNLAKWTAVQPVSEPIANTFRAMKTLRQVDDSHSPKAFVREWREKIKAVVDISHESPVYNPQDLDDGGIEYHKFPTVSKLPPTVQEVKDFVTLVDRLRSLSGSDDQRLIGVHCHYGFNRTGFFICSYLIERKGFDIEEAIKEFASRRPPGIRHEHFIDTLYVRYCAGLKRAPTLGDAS